MMVSGHTSATIRLVIHLGGGVVSSARRLLKLLITIRARRCLDYTGAILDLCLSAHLSGRRETTFSLVLCTSTASTAHKESNFNDIKVNHLFMDLSRFFQCG